MQTAKDKDEKRENVNTKVQERRNDKETDRNQAPSTNNRYQEAGGALKPVASPENQDHQNEDASQTELTHNNGENSTSEDTKGEEEEGDSEGNAMREKPTGRTGDTAETGRDEAKGDHHEEGKDNEQKKEAETVDEEERKVTTQSSETVTADHLPTEMPTAKDKDEKREIVNPKVQERGTDKETDRNQAPSTNNTYQEAGGALKSGASAEDQDQQNEDARQTELTHNNGENSTSGDTEEEEEEGDSEGNDAMRQKPRGRTGEAVETEGAEGHTEENASNKNQTAKTSEQDTANIAAGDNNAGEEGGGGDSTGSKTFPTSTCVFGEHGSLNVFGSPTQAPFSFIPGNTSTPGQPQEPGSRSGNDGKAFGERSTPPGIRGRSTKSASRQKSQKKQSSHHNAEYHGDSGMGKSLSASVSTSGHFVDPEQDHSLRESVEELTSGKLRLEETKKSLEEEIRQLKTKNHQLINQLEQQKDENSHLTKDRNALSVDRDRLNGENQEQTTELLAFYREKEHLTNQKSELVDERDGLNAECTDLRAYKADLESQNENLQQERADLQDRVSELEREGEEKDEKISVLSTTISQNSDMVATADEKTRRFQDVDMRLQHAQLSCSSLQSKLDEATASVQQLEAALKESNEGLGQEIVQLQANLYRLTNERDELQTTSENQVSQLTGDMDALRTKCDSLNVWVEKLTDAKACLEGEKNDLEGKLRRTEKEKKNLIADHEVLEAQNNSSEAAMREIADKRRQLEELKKNLEGQVADLQGEVKRKDEHTYGLSDTVARQCHALEGKERLEIEHQDVVTRLSDSQHQCATLQANVTDFTGRTQRLEAALAKEIEDHTREANALKVRVHELSNELGELQESSKREIASLAEVRSTLRSDCDRLNVRVDELENNKKRLEDKNKDLGERLKATERKAEELTTQKRVLERQKKTAEDQSVAYGQTSTVYQAQATQLQDLANAYRAQLETLTAQLRQRNESVLPLEMEARRARLEAQETAAKLERTTNEKDLLVITVDALKAEVQLNALAIQDWHRKEADLRSEMEKQVAQKNRYVKETQLARTQVKKLEERVHQLELQEANRFRRGFPRLD